MIPSEAGWYIATRLSCGKVICVELDYRMGVLVALDECGFKDTLDYTFHSRIEMPDERNQDGE